MLEEVTPKVRSGSRGGISGRAEVGVGGRGSVGHVKQSKKWRGGPFQSLAVAGAAGGGTAEVAEGQGRQGLSWNRVRPLREERNHKESQDHISLSQKEHDGSSQEDRLEEVSPAGHIRNLI